MPSYGQHSFLHGADTIDKEKGLCVNALVRATLISTDLNVREFPHTHGCKCPRTGNTHFYFLDAA